jgi:20S proteasome alpha/beta subunit
MATRSALISSGSEDLSVSDSITIARRAYSSARSLSARSDLGMPFPPGVVGAGQDSLKLIRRKPLKHDKGRPQTRRRDIREMTVCIAALASSGDCIICIADKALSYGEFISWESDTSKIIPFDSGRGVLMVSGGDNTSRVVRALASSSIGKSFDDTISTAEQIYRKCYEDVVGIHFFTQNNITKEEYISGILGQHINHHFEKIASEIYQFDLGVEILICGYCEDKKPYILLLQSPGKVVDATRQGFQAIGIGNPHATERLLFQGYKRTHGIPEVLYSCFDAKAYAELQPTVGYEWDAYIIAAEGALPIEEEVKPLLDKIWAKANRTPF